MKSLVVFMGKIAQLVIVFVVTFVLPALIISVIFMSFSVYKAVVTSPTYCAVMFTMSCIACWAYAAWKVDRARTFSRK